MKTKRGVSGVIVMILLILVALAAVAIIWGFVQTYLRTATGGINEATACLNADLAPVQCSIDEDEVTVSYKLNKGEISGVKIILGLDDGTNIVRDATNIPNELESKSHTITVDGNDYGNVKKATVAAVINLEGKDRTCEAYSIQVDCD